MSRHNTAALVAALLCVAAIGLAAATVAAPVDSEVYQEPTENPDYGDSTPFDFDIDQSVDWSEGESTDSPWRFTTRCVPFLLTPVFYGVAVLGFAAIFLGVRRKVATEYAFALVAFIIPISLFWHATLTEGCGTDPQTVDWGFPQGTMVNDTVQEASRTVSTDTGTPILGIAVAAAFLLLVVAALVTTVRQQSSGMEAEQAEPQAQSAHDLAGVAQVAGEAADRIEGGEADPGNAVYRAWQDMTSHLDLPNAKTATPAEFRAAALDAGMSRDHVSTLTDLFREVRYGGEEPTPDREENAIEALRAIEDAYGGDE